MRGQHSPDVLSHSLFSPHTGWCHWASGVSVSAPDWWITTLIFKYWTVIGWYYLLLGGGLCLLRSGLAPTLTISIDDDLLLLLVGLGLGGLILRLRGDLRLVSDDDVSVFFSDLQPLFSSSDSSSLYTLSLSSALLISWLLSLPWPCHQGRLHQSCLGKGIISNLKSFFPNPSFSFMKSTKHN